MDKFQNKYRIPSIRLKNWDYGNSAAYFVTICTQNRECFFGKVVNGKMQLSDIGIIANNFWYEIKNHAQNIELGAFVVMPNHVHGILILNGNGDGGNDNVCQKRFQNQGKNTLSSIIGSYKSAVSKNVHWSGFRFAWQPRFYDHIIRDIQSYKNISGYIISNPVKWNNDILREGKIPGHE